MPFFEISSTVSIKVNTAFKVEASSAEAARMWVQAAEYKVGDAIKAAIRSSSVANYEYRVKEVQVEETVSDIIIL